MLQVSYDFGASTSHPSHCFSSLSRNPVNQVCDLEFDE